MIQGEHT